MKSLNLALAFALSSPGLSAYAATANGLKVDQLFVRSQGAQDFHVAVQGKVAAELALRLPVETDPEMSPGTSDLTLLSPGSGLYISCGPTFPVAVLGKFSCQFDSSTMGGYEYKYDVYGKTVPADDLAPEFDPQADLASRIAPAIRSGKLHSALHQSLHVDSIDGNGERDGNSIPGDYVKLIGQDAYKLRQILPALAETDTQTIRGMRFVGDNQALVLECIAPKDGAPKSAAQTEGSAAWIAAVECKVSLK